MYLSEKLVAVTARQHNEESMEGVKTWLNSQAANFFHTVIQLLIPRYEKCHSLGGDYVEK
jgi:hypothetical protein